MNTFALRVFTFSGALAVLLTIAAPSANAGGGGHNNPPPPQFDQYTVVQSSTHGVTVKVPK